MDESTHKRCPRCCETKPHSDFALNRRTRDGLQCYCRACSSLVHKEYEANHAEALAARRMERLARRVDLTQTKVCRKCGEEKPHLEFYAHRSTVDMRANHCRACSVEAARSYREKNRDKVREWNAKRALDPKKVAKARSKTKEWRLRLYGLTPEMFDALLAAQDSVCAICGLPGQSWAERNLHIDHDHETGQVRGLLCGRCNMAIGYLHDDATLVARALEYLTTPPAKEVLAKEA